MRRFHVVTGPTRTLQDRHLDGTPYTIEAFETQLNALIARLDRDGAVNVAVDCKPAARDGWHVAYVSHGDVAAAATLDVEDVVRITGLSRTKVQNMVHLGELPRVPHTGRRIKIPAAAVDRLLAAV